MLEASSWNPVGSDQRTHGVDAREVEIVYVRLCLPANFNPCYPDSLLSGSSEAGGMTI